VADDFRTLLRREVPVTDSQAAALETHYQLLARWNRVLNLTSIRSMEEAVVRHYAECVFFTSLLPAVTTVLDFGSGGGFPGIPIAVMRAQCQVTLLESHQRKAVFLREAARSLSNVSVLSRRGEDAEGTWDLVVSRAVAAPEVIAQLPRFSQRIGLLAGGEFLGALPDAVRWEEPVRIPWGASRWALFGEVLQ